MKKNPLQYIALGLATAAVAAPLTGIEPPPTENRPPRWAEAPRQPASRQMLPIELQGHDQYVHPD